jgi:hypothetical protein
MSIETFKIVVTSRIDKHKADEAARLEAERAKMQAEATAKAEREAAAKLAAEEARIRAEEQAKARAEAVALANREQLAASERKDKVEIATKILSTVSEGNPKTVVETAAVIGIVGTGTSKLIEPETISYPGDQSIIEAIQYAYGVSYGTACDWLLEVAESLKVAA